MIPKIIHQFWIGDKARPKKWMDTWKEMNPTWEYFLWDDASLEDFKFENQPILDKLKEYHGIKDVCQYEIMRQYGGFFIDADTIALKPIPDYLLRFQAFTCYESEKKTPGYISVGYTASVPNHPIWTEIIEDLKTLTKYEPAWKTIGQLLWTKHASNRTDVCILPSAMFIPKHYSGVINGSEENAICKQFWGSTLSSYKEENYKSSFAF